MTKETVTPPQDRMYVDPETGDLSIGFDKAGAFAGKTGAIWDASAPLVMTSHPEFQQPEPRITSHPGDPMKEVMRIDRYGVKVNPEFTVDEATQHVLDALTAHIQHTINHAVAAEREACASILDKNAEVCRNNAMMRDVLAGNAAAIRARGDK